MARKTVFRLIVFSIPLVALIIAIGVVSYWTIRPTNIEIEGDPLIVYDPEIGFVPHPDGATRRTYRRPDGSLSLQYNLYTDRRGARVSRRGEQSPDRVDIVLLGDSFGWGHGMENPETFAFRTFNALGVVGANLAMASYGTTQSLQVLRRNRDLSPKLVIFELTSDHLVRNVLACARSYYPFCFDYSHVAWDQWGKPYIARPRGDGVARIQRHVEAEKTGLNLAAWILHGIDVALARFASLATQLAAKDRVKQDVAMEYLVEQFATTVKEMKAVLLILYLPGESYAPPPDFVVRSAKRLSYRFLDLSGAFASVAKSAPKPGLFLPNDGHPSAAGNALIAQELIAYLRHEKLLDP